MSDPWGQQGFGVRCEWGPVGAARLADPSGALVVVDVLSFTTSVCVAVERGTAVYPAAWGDGADLAREHGAALAVGRSEASAESPWTLSPASLRDAPAVPRLVLPSPNGSAIAAAASGLVVAACLRNASAVAQWLLDQGFGSPGRSVTVVPAGERWPDGSLRPGLEDQLGAGAVLAALGSGFGLSPEAAATKALFVATPEVSDAVRECASGRELVAKGYGADVEIAVQVGSASVVPVLVDGAFRAQGLPDRL